MKTTYLIGAGASCEAIPMVNDFAAKSEEVISNLKKHELYQNGTIGLTVYENLICKLKKGKSIDKVILERLEFRNCRLDSSVEKIKFFVWYVILYHHKKNGYDRRADKLLDNLFDGSGNFKQNVNVLSWNYDICLELALCKRLHNMEQSLRKLQSAAFSTEQLYDYSAFNTNYFYLIKLNGSTGFYHNGNNLINVVEGCNTLSELDIIDAFYKWSIEMLVCRMDFLYTINHAFEKSDIVYPYYRKALADLPNTGKLVVIGYSFPKLNCDVDLEILNSMSNLETIYLQNLGDVDARGRLEKILEGRDVKIVEQEPYTF